jgi:hypothetical protein
MACSIHRSALVWKLPMKLASVTAMVTPMLSADTGTAVRTGARAKLSAARRPEMPNSHWPGR